MAKVTYYHGDQGMWFLQVGVIMRLNGLLSDRMLQASIMLVFLGCLSFNSYASDCMSHTSPDELLKGVALNMITSINQKNFHIQENPDIAKRLIEEILLPHIDVAVASKNVLSTKWRELSREQKKQFMIAFRTFLTRYSSIKLAEYLKAEGKNIESDIIRFGDSVYEDDNLASVESSIFADDVTYKIKYMTRCNPRGWKVYDVVIDNISVIKQYQGQFREMMRTSGFSSLINFLAEKNETMLAGTPGTG